MSAEPIQKRKLDHVVPGARFGRLLVEAVVPAPDHVFGKVARRRPWVSALCDCGKRKAFIVDAIARGDVKSCGCKLREHRKEYTRRHQPVNRKATGKNLPA